MRFAMAMAMALLLCGCATVWPGLPLKVLPTNTHWCEGPRKPLVNRGSCASGDRKDEIVPLHVVAGCSPILRKESALRMDTFEGAIDFVLQPNAEGVVTDVCVVAGNYGDVTDYIECVVNEVRGLRILSTERAEWRLVYCVD